MDENLRGEFGFGNPRIPSDQKFYEHPAKSYLNLCFLPWVFVCAQVTTCLFLPTSPPRPVLLLKFSAGPPESTPHSASSLPLPSGAPQANPPMGHGLGSALPVGLVLSASLCSPCYHLCFLLPLFTLHHDGDREKARQWDSLTGGPCKGTELRLRCNLILATKAMF